MVRVRARVRVIVRVRVKVRVRVRVRLKAQALWGYVRPKFPTCTNWMRRRERCIGLGVLIGCRRSLRHMGRQD